MDNDYAAIAAESALPADAARQLSEQGFVVLPGPAYAGGCTALSAAYDRAVATADQADVSVRSSTRVSDFVNKGAEFDTIYVHPPLLAACCQIMSGPFKLSTMLGRTVGPGAPAQPLHVDVKRGADGWPLVGFIVMVDGFDAENGATRFVPGSHLLAREPDAWPPPTGDRGREVLACGSPGSMVVFNGSVWHGHSANTSPRQRRSIQGAFIPRDARAATDQASRIRPETLRRMSPVAHYVLGL